MDEKHYDYVITELKKAIAETNEKNSNCSRQIFEKIEEIRIEEARRGEQIETMSRSIVGMNTRLDNYEAKLNEFNTLKKQGINKIHVALITSSSAIIALVLNKVMELL